MAMMVSPDGREQMDVPDSLVAHYQSKGAQLVGASGSRLPAPVQSSPGQSGIQYSGAPDQPLNYGNNLIDTAIANPVETAQLLAGLPSMARAGAGLVRAIPRIANAGLEGAGEFLSALPRPSFITKTLRPAEQALTTDVGDAASLGARNIHPSDAGRALRAARDAKSAATIAQKEAAPAAEQTIARSLGDQGSSVEKFTAEVTPEAEKTAAGQAAKRTVKPGAKGAKGKPLPGSAESRIKVVPRNAGQAGKSYPKLARQDAARLNLVGKALAADDLEPSLDKAMQIEAEMTRRGFSDSERIIARKAIRGEVLNAKEQEIARRLLNQEAAQ